MSVITSIKAIILLGNDGRRGIAQYYDDQLAATCKQFEKKLFARTKSAKGRDEILVLDGVQIVHKFARDYHIYVVGSRNESILVLDKVLCCLVTVITSPKFCNDDFRSRIVLALDEICDSGIILEIDPNLVIKRVVYHEDVESLAQRTARLFGI